MKIWLDDERPKPDIHWFHARNSYEAIRALSIYYHFRNAVYPTLGLEAISLDHDLGEGDDSRKVVLWMINHDFWPQNVYVHTMNPIGREWLVGMINKYGPGVSQRNS